MNDTKKNWTHGDNRPRIIFDCDDVILDLLSNLVQRHNEINGTNFIRDDVKSWDLSLSLGRNAFDIFKEKGFFLNLKEKNEAVALLRELINSKRYDVYIVTACQSATEYAEKILNLGDLIPEFNPNRIISLKEKELIRADLIIDDNPANLRKCKPYMDTILYDMPHNQDETEFIRIKNFDSFMDILDLKFYPNVEEK